MFFSQPLKLGSLTLKNRLILAPLAGVSDVPFRRICQEWGAGLTYVEMLSATAIKYENKRTFQMMARHASEGILGVQVTGSSAQDVAHAAQILEKQGFETIDINMGCPVKKVVNAGCGSAILKDPERISRTVHAAVAAVGVPVSCKIRLGYTRPEVNVHDTVERAVSNGVKLLTIHGRTRSEGYDTPVDRQGIQQGVDAARRMHGPPIALLGNGDIFCLNSARATVQQSRCDGVMISRGALGNPWLFSELLQERNTQPNLEEWLHTVEKHLGYAQEFYGDNQLAATLMRKHLIWYAKGFPGAKILREHLQKAESIESQRQILKEYASTQSKHLVRFSAEANAHRQTYDPKFDMDRKLDRGVGDEDMTPNYTSNG